MWVSALHSKDKEIIETNQFGKLIYVGQFLIHMSLNKKTFLVSN